MRKHGDVRGVRFVLIGRGVAVGFAALALCVGAAAYAANDGSEQATAAESAAGKDASGAAIAEIIVTANKREENIQNVGMSIQAASGDQLTKLGIIDTESLQKIVPGFLSTPNYLGTTVFTIRGVGFQDVALASSPTVSVYVDEAPLPFSVLSKGAMLDLERVEVLKGPQGTLFGENATGGAINYIASKPTDTFHAGGDVSYGNFSDTKIDGYVSGPLNDTVDGRIALQTHTSDAWQQGYGSQSGQSIGGADFLNGRVSLLWKPADSFRALLTMSGWQDKSVPEAAQLYGIAQTEPTGPINPNLVNYPVAPRNDRAAGWNPCINTSPYDALGGQAGGALWLTPSGALESEGPGSVAWAGGQPTHCAPPRDDQNYYGVTWRMDYELGGDMTLTSLTEYQKFDRRDAFDASGAPFQQNSDYLTGDIKSVYQEFRLAGKWGGKGNWLIGANYEHDDTIDRGLGSFNGSSDNPLALAYNSSNYSSLFAGSPTSTQFTTGGAFLLPFGPIFWSNTQNTNTYAAYANADYPILDSLNLEAGARFTQENKYGNQCTYDSGDGTLAAILYQVQQFSGSTSPVLSAFGGCATVGTVQNNYNSPPGGIASNLDQNNVSWHVGFDYKLTPQDLLYLSVSQGYKGGSYPTIPLETEAQDRPVVQEGLLAYEVGFKSTLFDRQLQLNGAAFYYDYSNKQILGSIPSAVLGYLSALVNVPQAHVVGFELSGIYSPNWLQGLNITPAVSYQHSRIDRSSKNVCTTDVVSTLASEGLTCRPGDFYNYDSFGELADFTGESFPSAPQWQASIDGEYDWRLHGDLTAFVGVHLQYTSSTNSGFVNRTPLQPEGGYNLEGVAPDGPYDHPNDPLYVRAYTLTDLRAGIQMGDWRLQVWGRNVLNTYYWTGSYAQSDVLIRYAGMPATYGLTLSASF